MKKIENKIYLKFSSSLKKKCMIEYFLDHKIKDGFTVLEATTESLNQYFKSEKLPSQQFGPFD